MEFVVCKKIFRSINFRNCLQNDSSSFHFFYGKKIVFFLTWYFFPLVNRWVLRLVPLYEFLRTAEIFPPRPIACNPISAWNYLRRDDGLFGVPVRGFYIACRTYNRSNGRERRKREKKIDIRPSKIKRAWNYAI